jgi:hypothetical protein
MNERDTPEEGSPYASAVPQLARSTLWPSAVVGALGGIALMVWGITWLALDRPLGWVLVLLGVGSLAAIGRIAWKAVRARRAHRP